LVLAPSIAVSALVLQPAGPAREVLSITEGWTPHAGAAGAARRKPRGQTGRGL